MTKNAKRARAMQQKITAGIAIFTSGKVVSEPSKAQIRASIPAYDESMVRRIETPPRKKKLQ